METTTILLPDMVGECGIEPLSREASVLQTESQSHLGAPPYFLLPKPILTNTFRGLLPLVADAVTSEGFGDPCYRCQKEEPRGFGPRGSFGSSCFAGIYYPNRTPSRGSIIYHSGCWAA